MNKFAILFLIAILICPVAPVLAEPPSPAVTAVSAEELRPFASDGCSLFPDGTIRDGGKWCDCCLNHDIAYWQGGTRGDREKADRELRACVLERTGDKVLAETMYLGVRAGGAPAFPTGYRWAYGWHYGRNYRSLTDEEQAQVRQKLGAYREKHPLGYCVEHHPGSAASTTAAGNFP